MSNMKSGSQEPKQEKITLIVASTNQNKIDAAITLEKTFGSNIQEVLQIGVPSDVPEQPVGYDQGFLGAQNRLNHIRKILAQSEDHSVVSIISIESFLVVTETSDSNVDPKEEKEITVTDIPCVIHSVEKYTPLGNKISEVTTTYGEPVNMPVKYYLLSKATGFTKTAGSFIEAEFNLKKDGWFEYLNRGKSRVDQILAGSKTRTISI